MAANPMMIAGWPEPTNAVAQNYLCEAIRFGAWRSDGMKDAYLRINAMKIPAGTTTTTLPTPIETNPTPAAEQQPKKREVSAETREKLAKAQKRYAAKKRKAALEAKKTAAAAV